LRNGVVKSECLQVVKEAQVKEMRKKIEEEIKGNLSAQFNNEWA